jgi:hypothetical protein
MTSFPVYPPDSLESAENTQVDVPSITSFFGNLSTFPEPASLIDDLEQQANFVNGITNDPLTMSPIFLASTPAHIFNHNDTTILFNDLVNIDKNMPILRPSSEQHSTLASSTISAYSSTPIKTSSVGFDSNKSPLLNSSNSFGNNVTISKTSTEPRVRFVSKETEIADGFTESSIEITSKFLWFFFIYFLYFFLDILYIYIYIIL